MAAQECPFRRCVELPPKVQKESKELVDSLNLLLPDPSTHLRTLAFTTEPVCTHEDAPFIIFAGLKDQYLCDFCIKNDLCPLKIKPENLLC